MTRIALFLLLCVSFGEKNAVSGLELTEINSFVNNFKQNANLFENGTLLYEEVRFPIDFGNPDINARIERPCEIYDTFCIRQFFAEHSKCRISAERLPEPLYRARLTDKVPSLNITTALVNVEYTGLRTGRIEEFYINKATDNLIITFGFDSISFNGYAHVKFYRPGREPFVTSDYAGANFGRLSITLVIPQLGDLRLDRAHISTFLQLPVYTYFVGPGIVPKDPELLPTFALIPLNPQTNQKEVFLTEGKFIAATFMQYNICDFGLKIV